MNKKGWTLVGELVVFLIIIILLIYSIYGLYRFGLVKNINRAIPGVKPQLVISGETVNYETAETELIEASKRYIYDKYNGSINGDVLILRVNHLIGEGYLSTIRDTNSKVCSGYVKVYNNGNLTYNPYLKCRKYTSFGYESEYDF